jgi:preprotein translocase subunit SecG|tara:strand:- start:7876 stop:8187 length:312 start_codon:yes stop_codon:yes gene_type:complete
MENIVLLIHIILAIILIIVILLQRAEGGALGIGGGSDGMTPRGSGDMLTRITAIIATFFIITSITLAIMSMRSSNNSLNFDDQNTSSDIELLNNNLLEKPELN